MAGSRYEYVKLFEEDDKLLPGCWGVIRLDGRGFTRFAKVHDFTKPNDKRALDLCNAAAARVLEAFDEHLCFAFGQSDEYSFILRRESTLFSRRRSKILSTVVSLFSASYVKLWASYMGSDKVLHDIPSFDGRVVLYPTTKHLRDYLSWRQADVHVNNLFNTTFWNLVKSGSMTTTQAEKSLKRTLAKDKHEILFSQFGINYNDEPDMFKKGSFLVKTANLTHNAYSFERVAGDASAKKEDGGDVDGEDGGNEFVAIFGDIIGDEFWNNNPAVLGQSDLNPPRIRKR